MARLKSLLKSAQMYELLKDAKGALFLDVVVGSSALYTLRLALDDAEAKGFKKDGEAFLDKLAARVVKDEKKFAGRTTRVD